MFIKFLCISNNFNVFSIINYLNRQFVVKIAKESKDSNVKQGLSITEDVFDNNFFI